MKKQWPRHRMKGAWDGSVVEDADQRKMGVAARGATGMYRRSSLKRRDVAWRCEGGRLVVPLEHDPTTASPGMGSRLLRAGKADQLPITHVEFVGTRRVLRRCASPSNSKFGPLDPHTRIRVDGSSNQGPTDRLETQNIHRCRSGPRLSGHCTSSRQVPRWMGVEIDPLCP